MLWDESNDSLNLRDSVYLQLGNSNDFNIYHDGSHNYIFSSTVDQDIIFKGNDGGSNITALTLDMSAGGAAFFNGDISAGSTGDLNVRNGNFTGNVTLAGGKNLLPATNNSGSLGNDGHMWDALWTNEINASSDGVIYMCNQGGSLVVEGTVSATGNINVWDGQSGVDKAIIVQAHTEDASLNLGHQGGTYWKIYSDYTGGGSAYQLTITDSGGNDGVKMAQNATGWSSNSDERIKRDIVELEDSLDKLNTLRCVNFNYNHDDKDLDKRIGLIAQDVYKVYPEAITGTPDKKVTYDANKKNGRYNNAMNLRYTELIAPMIKAIQELSAKVEALENA
jgi:hypothetical protein